VSVFPKEQVECAEASAASTCVHSQWWHVRVSLACHTRRRSMVCCTLHAARCALRATSGMECAMAAHSDKPRHGTCAEAAQANRCTVLPVVWRGPPKRWALWRGPPKRWAHAPDRSSTPPPPRHILPNARPTACANAFWSGPCTATPSDSTDAVSAIAGRSVLALIRRSSSRACISSTSYRQFTLAPDAPPHAKRSFSSPHDGARARSGGARVALAHCVYRRGGDSNNNNNNTVRRTGRFCADGWMRQIGPYSVALLGELGERCTIVI
jgi:hypothetical protein